MDFNGNTLELCRIITEIVKIINTWRIPLIRHTKSTITKQITNKLTIHLFAIFSRFSILTKMLVIPTYILLTNYFVSVQKFYCKSKFVGNTRCVSFAGRKIL